MVFLRENLYVHIHLWGNQKSKSLKSKSQTYVMTMAQLTAASGDNQRITVRNNYIKFVVNFFFHAGYYVLKTEEETKRV